MSVYDVQVEVAESTNLEYWRKKWEGDDTTFYNSAPYGLLLDHIDEFLAGRERLKIMVPLCGKSKDMIVLSDLGHSVVGIECSELAVAMFFEENDIKHSVHSVPGIQGAVLYKSDSDRLHIYVCDLFDFTVEIAGTFQGIWDCASIVAITKEQRVTYCNLMRSLMARDCHYFLVALEFDDSNFIDAPHSLSLREIQDFFEILPDNNSSLAITSLKHLTREPRGKEMKDARIAEVHETLYLIKYHD